MTDQQKQFVVSLEQFEGPLDLLHQLIENRKLQINTVSLSKVTADYMQHIKEVGTVKAEEIAQFVYVASILILIKSKSLLPILEYTKEEEGDAQVLEQRVQLYSFIQKKAMPALDTWKRVMYGVVPPKQPKEITFIPDSSCTTTALQQNAQSVIHGLRFVKEPPRKHVSRTINIAEVIDTIMKKISEKVCMKMDELQYGDKQECIIHFLAILELVRKELLEVNQDAHFGDIVIQKRTTPV